MSARWHRWDHHPPCRCGCGELADECAGPNPNPLGSMRVVEPVRAPWPVMCGKTANFETDDGRESREAGA